MPAHKRKASDGNGELQGIFEKINESCLGVKPKLASLSTISTDTQKKLCTLLDQLAVLAESFSVIRSQLDPTPAIHEFCNILDQEGVNLWNASGLFGHDNPPGSDDNRQLYARLRLSGFRLIEAGLVSKSESESLIRLLHVASKAGIALSDAGRNDAATTVMNSAAGYQERLQSLELDEPSTNGPPHLSKDKAVLLYYCGRMVTAWNEGNQGIAEYMLDKIDGGEPRINSMSLYDREATAARIFNIGKSALRSATRLGLNGSTPYFADEKSVQSAIKWLQRSFALIEEDTGSESVVVLKRDILRTLARAYFLSFPGQPENLAYAETTLNELVALLDNRTDERLEAQTCLWMKLAVLKKREATENELLAAFNSITDLSEFSEVEVTDILQELRTMSLQRTLVTSVLLNCLRLLLARAQEDKIVVINRLFLAVLFHCSKDNEHDRAIATVRSACSLFSSHAYELEQTPATACVTILWQIGDRHYHNRHWLPAAEWFLLASHEIFNGIAQVSQEKCLRKAALCYIGLKEYSTATTIIARCSPSCASTNYLHFLCSIHQGFDEQAIDAIHHLITSQNFHKRMILLVIRFAHETNKKMILLAALKALLDYLNRNFDPDSMAERVLLVRCIVRLQVVLYKEGIEQNDKSTPIISIIAHLRTVVQIVNEPTGTIDLAHVSKDISWLWRIAYNTAVQACDECDDADKHICELFELSSMLLRAYIRICGAGVDADTRALVVFSSFASATGRVFLLRHSDEAEPLCTKVLAQLRDIRSLITQLKGQACSEGIDSSMDRIIYSVDLFEIELRCRMNDWSEINVIVAGIDKLPLSTAESIIGLLWCKDCPTHVLYTALEAILHLCLRCNSMSVESFSRWLRSMCTFLLARNKVEDRTKAISYIEQALGVLQENEGDTEQFQFPIEERQWLLSTTYNTGLECLTGSSASIEEARRWLHASVVLCRHVPNEQGLAKQVLDVYEDILAYDSQRRE